MTHVFVLERNDDGQYSIQRYSGKKKQSFVTPNKDADLLEEYLNDLEIGDCVEITIKSYKHCPTCGQKIPKELFQTCWNCGKEYPPDEMHKIPVCDDDPEGLHVFECEGCKKKQSTTERKTTKQKKKKKSKRKSKSTQKDTNASMEKLKSIMDDIENGG